MQGQEERVAGMGKRTGRENLNERGIREVNLSKEKKKLEKHRVWEEECLEEEERRRESCWGQEQMVFHP